MNVIYMHTHDTGRYIEPYGYNIPTPKLMEFAKEGTIFRQAFCAGPTCSPSRAGLLSGMTPHSCGMLGLAHRGFQMDCSKHLVRFLNDNGYETALAGVQHEMPEAGMIGYKKILDKQNYHMRNRSKFDSVKFDLENANIAADYIKEKKDKPFFLSFGMYNTHKTFPKADSDINPNYIQSPWTQYDNRQNREEMAGFLTSARVVDKCVGIITHTLRESGNDGDTMVIFTTDHGIPFPKMKCSLFDVGIGVSLIINFPGNKMKGCAIDSLVSQVDIFPTICDLAGLDRPNWLQGVSLIPLFEGTTDKVRDEIFAEINYHAAYEPSRCIRTERYKLIEFYDNHNNVIPSNWDDGPSKRFLIENGYLNEVKEREMLFDLYLDPVERINRINDSRYTDVYNDLSLRLEKWMKQTNDPLFTGRIPAPNEAIVNKRSSLSPSEDNFE